MSLKRGITCGESEACYTCPRCYLTYCSVSCYKSVTHSKCSEAFYQDQIVTELSHSHDQNESRQQMEEILLRLYKEQSPSHHNLVTDSDDSEEDASAEVDMITRLAGVNLDDADAVWQRLSVAEQADFEKLLKTGGITELLPTITPWWERTSRFVQEVKDSDEPALIPTKNSDDKANCNTASFKTTSKIPSIIKDIPPFQTICKKTVSPCLKYNVANIIAAYVFTVRSFNGEHLDWPSHAAYVVWGLCGNLNNNQNFNTVQDAFSCVAACASQKEGASQEDLSALKADAQCIISCPFFQSAALSDLLSLFRAASRQRPSTAKGPFSQRFCDGADHQLPKDKLKLAVKKLEFMVSWALQN